MAPSCRGREERHRHTVGSWLQPGGGRGGEGGEQEQEQKEEEQIKNKNKRKKKENKKKKKEKKENGKVKDNDMGWKERVIKEMRRMRDV